MEWGLIINISRHCPMSMLPPFPKSFTAEAVRSDQEGRLMIYVDGEKKRFVTYSKSGQTEIHISRPVNKHKIIIWKLDPKTKTYSQTKTSADVHVINPDTLYDWREDGVEMIGGRRCQKFIGKDPETCAPFLDANEICFVDAKTGMRRRMVTYNLEGTLVLTVDYLNAKIGSLPKSLFETKESL
jgi:outer membrane lipoprotein-sorting protein